MSDVLIIGAGVAGISAAFHLSRAGFRVRIIEITDSIGGRLTALFDSKSSDMIDNGQHALMTAYDTFLEIVEAADANKYFNFQSKLHVDYYDSSGRKSVLDAGCMFGKAGLLLGLLKLGGLSFSSKIKIIKLFLYIQLSKSDSNDNISCREFLNLHRQSDESIKRFWEPLIVAVLNCNLENASALLLINVLKKAFIDDINNSKLVLPSADFKLITEKIQNHLQSCGVEIITRTKINSIITEKANVSRIIDSKGAQYQADYYISTLPPYSLQKIVDSDDGQFDYLSQFAYSPIISAYIWTDIEIFREDFISMIDSHTQWIFNRNKLIKHNLSEKFKYSYSITISYADSLLNMKNSELINLISGEIERVFPHFSEKNILHYRVITEKFATFTADVRTEFIRPDCKTNLNNFFLAGDWTNTGLPATIEGAAISGKRAAEAVIGLLEVK
ncbi:MAG: hydroxysqualene dehydroxylase HpnE [Candidatus Kapaibacterium sp.]|nr:hydroxysqualene dehydroxylase HpnE [Candidatus Kapabacteria bacterium]